MGNTDSYIHRQIPNFKIDDKENDQLIELFHNYVFNQNNEFILKDNLIQILQLSDQDLFEIFFEIFHKKHPRFRKVLYFRHLKKIYYSLTTINPQIKIIFISLLLFKKSPKIKINELIENIKKIFKVTDLSTHLLTITLPITIDKNAFKDKIEKAKFDDIFYSRKEFIKLCNNNENIEFFTNFKFLTKKFIGSSKYNSGDGLNLNFVCDCCKKKIIKDDDLDTMKSGYDSLTRDNKGILYLNNFQTLLKQYDIHPKMINLVIEFLKKYTEKDYCCYNDIKYIFSNLNYSASLNDKKKFLFKMILTISGNDQKDNEISYKEIYKYLNLKTINNKKGEKIIKEDEINTDSKLLNENNTNEINTDSKNLNENNSEEINTDSNNEINTDSNNLNEIEDNEEEDNLETKDNIQFKEEDMLNENDILDEIFINLIPNLEIFGLLPYLLFEAKTNDKTIKRKIIKYLLKTKKIDNFETYLETHFNECKLFYVIDINFWNALMDENVEIPDYINNSRIAEELNIITEKDKFEKEEYNEKVKEMEEENKKKSKNKNKTKDKKEDKKEDNKEDKKEDKEIKDNNDNAKQDNIEENKIKEIELIQTKDAKLKKNLKYKKDFVILCDELYKIITNNYKLDYEIKLKKIKNVYLKTQKKDKNNDKDKDKDKDNDTDNKKNDENKEIKDSNGETKIDKSENDKEKNEEEKKEEILKKEEEDKIKKEKEEEEYKNK